MDGNAFVNRPGPRLVDTAEMFAAAIAGELADVDEKLRGVKRPLPMLDRVAIATPCSAVWDNMAGDDRVRFCGDCQKNVYNLSAMTREEGEALLEQTNAGVCVRFYQRADGKVEILHGGLRRSSWHSSL